MHGVGIRNLNDLAQDIEIQFKRLYDNLRELVYLRYAHNLTIDFRPLAAEVFVQKWGTLDEWALWFEEDPKGLSLRSIVASGALTPPGPV